MAHKVKCRVCGMQFDTDALKKEEWIMPSRNFYYHTKCYNEWKVNSRHDDKEWIELIYDFLSRDLKVKYDYFLCEAQRKKFIEKNKYTNKGILFALKYHYDIKNGDWSKSNGGLGIIPYVYKDSCEYWTQQELQKRGTLELIEKQMKARENMPVKRLIKQTKQREDKWNLDDI